jgi:polysaccharide biosynthesis transport protein
MATESNSRPLPTRYTGEASPEGKRDFSADQLQRYLDLLRRRWWLIAAAALVGLAGAWWNVQNRVPMYSAEVLLEQQRETPVMGMGLRGMGSADFAQQLETIRTRAVMSEVVERLGLQLNLRDREGDRSRIFGGVEVDADVAPGPYTLLRRADGRLLLLEGAHPNGGDTISSVHAGEWLVGPGFRLRVGDPTALEAEPIHFSFQNRQAAVERLRRQVTLEPGRAPSLVRIGYRSQDPQLAAQVANSVAETYREYRAQTGKEAASRRREAIAEQLVALADSLQDAQAAVVQYQREARLLDPAQEGTRTMETVVATENDLRTLRFQEGLLSSVVAGLQGDGQIPDESLDRILSLGGDLVPGGAALHQRLQDLKMERARLTASRFGRTQGDPEVEVVDSLIHATKTQIRSSAEQGLEHLRVQLSAAEQRLGEARANMSTIPAQTAQLAQLRQRADAVQEIVDALVDRYYEAQISESVEAGDIAIIDPAAVPLTPDSSPTRVLLLVGLLTGGILGSVGALGIEYMDLRVRGSDEAEEITGLPLFGMIPKLGSPSRDPVSAAIAREAFRSVRTNLSFAQPQGDRLIAVTSATPREGKTTVAVNIAVSLTEQGGAGSVLLVDADLRRPQVHSSLHMSRGPGLTELLARDVAIEEAVRVSPTHSGLHVLSAGGPVSNPSDLLAGPRFSELLKNLRTHYGFIVIDTPPLLAVSDGLVVSKLVDGTLVVVRANQTDRDAVENAMDHLRRVDASLLGVILNGVEAKSRDGRYAYAYYDDYLVENPGDSTETDGGKDRLLQEVGRHG